MFSSKHCYLQPSAEEELPETTVKAWRDCQVTAYERPSLLGSAPETS